MNKEKIQAVFFGTLILIALSFTFLFIIVTFIEQLTGYDVIAREKCVDRYYAEFEDEYCMREYHCGIISQQFDSKCSGGNK